MKLVKDSPGVIFSHSPCCMCHSIKVLLYGYGGNPAVYELDEMARGAEIERVLTSLLGKSPPVPAVFVGGRLIGHIQDVPLSLTQASSFYR